jgi:uncharacterized protein
MKRNILTIDGGGIKGIIPAYVCYEIEKQTGKKINELFDLISGSSTGSILGAGLAVGIPAETMLNMYINHGKDIFKKRIKWFRPWEYLTTPKYNREIIIDFLNNNYGHNTKITDINKTKFISTAYDIINRKYEFFTSYQDRYKNRRLVDIVLYSMSAIYYFGKTFDPIINTFYSDGAMSLFASTSVITAIETPKLGWLDDDKYILNLGCGYSVDKELTIQSVKNWRNLRDVINIFLPKETLEINNLKSNILNSPLLYKTDFDVINCEIHKSIDKLDGVENIDELIKIAESLVNKLDIHKILK